MTFEKFMDSLTLHQGELVFRATKNFNPQFPIPSLERMSYAFYEKNSKEKLAETLKNEIKGCYEFIKKLEDDKAFLEMFESKIIGKYKELSGTKDYDSLIKDVVSWKDWKRLEKCHCSPQHDLNDWKEDGINRFYLYVLDAILGFRKIASRTKKLILSLSEDIENLKGLIEELERLDQKS